MASSRKQLYAGKVIDVGIENVRLPNGRDAELEIVRHPGGSAIVALDARGRVCLLRQYRHAAGGWLWELPAGKREPGETPDQTARRELADEAGVAARRWHSLGTMLPSPAVFTEVIHLYLARDLRDTGSAHERDEVIEIHWLAFGAALARAQRGEITDAKSAVGLLRAAPHLAHS